MKRTIICLMLLALMLTGTMSVHAAEAEVSVQICASQTEVNVGDTVEFTVLATGSGVVAMQFNLALPEGLSYVPNSGATPENLAQKLGVPAADWTEQTLMFTFYNDVGITFAKGTEILHFTCVAEKAGQWQVNLYELLPFDENFEEFTPKLQLQTITVRGAETGTEATDPVTPEETQPTDSELGTQTQPTDPNSGGDENEPIEPTVEKQVESGASDTVTTGQIEPTKDEEKQEKTANNTLIWIISAVAVTLVTAGVVAFILIKKKKV